MAVPWFEPNHFGAWYGVIAGGIGGTLGGILGGLTGVLAPRGIGRTWILAAMGVFVAVGIIQVGFALYALAVGQPWNIWFWPLQCGGVYVIVIGAMIPMVRMRYRQAEDRLLEAEALRKS